MKFLAIILTCFLCFSLQAAEELDASQLEGLSDCDYFKYTQCTSANLTIGACVKNKYNDFVVACGKVHADKFIYSREMFKPAVKKSKKQTCRAAREKLCGDSLLSDCAKKNGKELAKACGDEFAENASKPGPMDDCSRLRDKICGEGVTLECDAKYEASAPAHCKGDVSPREVKLKSGVGTEKSLMGDCMKTITSKCKLDTSGKDEKSLKSSMRKYEVCVQRTLLKATGKCGSHFPGEADVKKEVEKANK